MIEDGAGQSQANFDVITTALPVLYVFRAKQANEQW
jgi:hypothetical protein